MHEDVKKSLLLPVAVSFFNQKPSRLEAVGVELSACVIFCCMRCSLYSYVPFCVFTVYLDAGKHVLLCRSLSY